MIKSTLLSSILALISVSLFAVDSTTKQVSTSASNISWVGKKVTGEHSGTIGIKEGELEFEDGNLVSGSFVIDMNSLTVTDLEAGKGKEKLEGHLMADDFFGVTAHPTATLEITEATSKGGDMYDVNCNLTIKGITKPISFSAKVGASSATAEIIVDRTEFNVKYGSTKFGALADKAIYDDFTLNVSLEYGEVTTKAVNVKNSSIEWVGKKVGGQHSGTIGIKSGSLEMANGALVGGEFIIDMTSLQVTDLKAGRGKEKLEGHLSADDFFGTADHPTAQLDITNVDGKGDSTYNITADLTIKGITHPVSFVAALDGNTATADFSVDRTLYDVKYGSTKFGALADKAIYDDFELIVSLAL